MLPETRGKNNKKYDFDSMKSMSYISVDNQKIANSMRATAAKRGYRVAVRTVDNEIRVYYLGRRK